MKKCLQCPNLATRHITEIDGDEVRELHLCEGCTKDYLAAPEAGPPDAADVVEQVASLTADADLDELDQLVCPQCGISFKEFRRQGRLGCPHDYTAFADELLPLLENIHNETEHVGKYPKRAPNATEKHSRLIRLRGRLGEAIEAEHYEEAARLRDEIESLEQEIEASHDE